MFSIKMRSSKGGINGLNGKHISGAERIVGTDEVESTVLSMLRRARSHERGQADFINIKIAEFGEDSAVRIPLLPVYENIPVLLTKAEKSLRKNSFASV